MADEGIMALPQGMGMQGEGAQPPRPTVTSADSYDAAQTALGMVNPQEQASLKEAIRQNIGDLQITPQQLDVLIQALEYVSQNPGDYKNLLQKMIETGALDEGDMPPEYDPEFIGTMIAVLQEMRQMQGAGAQEPMNLSPAVEGLQPMGMASGGLADVGQYLASKGRGGDRILAHITPEEAALLKRRGGAGTINPATGLPEFKDDPISGIFKAVGSVVKGVVDVTKDLLKSPVGKILGTIALATVLGPTAIGASLGSAGTAALASGTITLASGGNIKDALVSGAMGYIGGGGTVMGVNPISAVGNYLPGAAGGLLNTGLATGVISAGIGKLGGMTTEDALKMGLTSGVSAAALSGLKDTSLGGGAKEQAPRNEAVAGNAASASSADSIGATGQIGQAGAIGDAQSMLASGNAGTGLKMPSMGSSTSYNPVTDIYQPDYSFGQGSTSGFSGLRMNAPPTTGVAGMEGALGTGLRATASPATSPTGATNYNLTGMSSAPSAQPTDLMGRMVSGAKDLYGEYLSPSRPGLPKDAGILQKYGPLALAGTAVMAATGGMEGEPADPNPLFDRSYTAEDYRAANPDKFKGGLSSYTKPAEPRNPIVPSSSFGTIPVTMPTTATPTGVSRSRAVAQPYNVAGLYGVPLIYGSNNPPPGGLEYYDGPPPGPGLKYYDSPPYRDEPFRRMAQGGDAKMTSFPRRQGPINGKGTGTSDDIPAMLSDGEFVFTAKAVRNAGNGSRRKGAARMYKLMKKLEGGAVKGK
jgi:hypothetical protein